MPQKFDKALRLAFHAVALALVIMAIIQAFAPYLGGPDPRAVEIRQTVSRILAADPGDIPAVLQHTGGKPVMLIVYASWCGPCRLEMPRIVGMLQDGRLNRFRPMFLSLDKEPHAMAAYLVHNDYHTLFTPYLLTSDNAPAVVTALHAAGSGFSGSIPYIGFFNAQGKLAAEFLGIPSDTQLRKAIAGNGGF